MQPEVVTTFEPFAVSPGVHHDHEPRVGVQFHPESILTGEGKQLIANFLDRYATAPTAGTADGDGV